MTRIYRVCVSYSGATCATLDVVQSPDWLERVMPDAVGPANDIALLLSTPRAAGHIVRDRRVGEVIEYTTSIDGHAYTGRGPDDHTAVCALMLTCGWDLE